MVRDAGDGCRCRGDRGKGGIVGAAAAAGIAPGGCGVARVLGRGGVSYTEKCVALHEGGRAVDDGAGGDLRGRGGCGGKGSGRGGARGGRGCYGRGDRRGGRGTRRAWHGRRLVGARGTGRHRHRRTPGRLCTRRAPSRRGTCSSASTSTNTSGSASSGSSANTRANGSTSANTNSSSSSSNEAEGEGQEEPQIVRQEGGQRGTKERGGNRGKIGGSSGARHPGVRWLELT